MIRSVGLWLFVTSACFYLLCTSGHTFTLDGVVMYQVTQSIADRGALSAAGPTRWSQGSSGTTVIGPDGQPVFYAKYGIGLSLAAIPAYLLGRMLVPFLDQSQRDLFQIPKAEEARLDALKQGRPIVVDPAEDFRFLWYDPGAGAAREGFLVFCTTWTNSFVAAGIVLGVFLIGREIGYPVTVALATAVLAGIGTPLWAYAKDLFSEPLGALGLTYFLYFAMRGRATDRAWYFWILSGLALGVSALAKPVLIVLAAPAGLLLARYARPLSLSRACIQLGGFALGLGGAGALILVYNYLRFGSIFETGYGSEVLEWTTPVVAGLYGLLIAPGRGILIYFPLWFLLMPATRMFPRERRAELAFIIVSFGLLLGLHAKWHNWEGGVCWGPRFLLPAVPLLVVPIGALLETWPARQDVRVIATLVITAAIVVAFSGTMVNYLEYANWVRWRVIADTTTLAAQGIGDAYQLIIYDPAWAPVTAYWTFPRKDYYFVFDALRRPGFVLGIYTVLAVGFVVSLALLARAVRGGADRSAHGETPYRQRTSNLPML